MTSVDANSQKSGYADFGGWVDVAAPGDGIQSTFLNGASALWSGTSMATPFVAGQAALIHSVSPTAKPSDVEGAIGGTARSLNYADPAYSGKLGKGLINVGASLGKLKPGAGCGG